jgi:hypothetical protein
MSDRVFSEHVLERYLLGELPREDTAAVERAAAADPRIREALTALEGSSRDILARYPAASFKARLLERLEDTTGPAPIWMRWAVPVSAAAVLVVAVVLVGPKIRQWATAPPAVRAAEDLVKGEAALDMSRTQLLVYKKSGDLAELVGDGFKARPGALLQLAYIAASARYGMILSIDGRGGVTTHFPVGEGVSTVLSPRHRILLPDAIELDDAPGFERFFLITSDEPVDIEAVRTRAVALASDPAAAARGELDLPPGLDQTSVLILKGEGVR